MHSSTIFKKSIFLLFCAVGIFLFIAKSKNADVGPVEKKELSKDEITKVKIKKSSAAPLVVINISKKTDEITAQAVSAMPNFAEDLSLATNPKIVNATEIYDDGHLNLNGVDTKMVNAGKLFTNELAKLAEFERGDLVEIKMPNINSSGVISKKEIDVNGNITVVLKFPERNHGYLLLYQSTDKFSNGEIFIDGKHYDYTANSDVGVIVDMKVYAPWPID